MSDDTLLTRRQFTVESALAMLAASPSRSPAAAMMTTTRPPIRHQQPTRPRRSAQTPVIPIPRWSRRLS
jgi:hypothetical protein